MIIKRNNNNNNSNNNNNKMWTCSKCGYQNGEFVSICDICNKKNGKKRK